MYRHLLVPIDDDDLSIEVVGSAVGLARAVGARITFFHADADPAKTSAGESPRPNSMRPAEFASAFTGKAAELLAKAEAAARAFGVPCDSRHVINARLGDAIIEAARSEGCDLVVVALPEQGEPGAAPASETLSAVTNAGISVLMPKVEDPGPSAHAVAVIRDEHRLFAAVLRAWMHLLGTARAAGRAADPRLMREIVGYVESFALTLHEPKEEDHLFNRLRARTSATNAELDELQRQHARGRQRVADLVGRVATLGAASSRAAVSATRDLDEAVRSYASFMWDHLGREEGVILPAARRYLSRDDWSAIDAAFMANRAPGASGDADSEVRRLFSLMVDAAPRSS
jgi:hemerythrin-like domain-containing protein/nucleotide-binding universal stress UspA family protein